jgi:hypothetical protein
MHLGHILANYATAEINTLLFHNVIRHYIIHDKIAHIISNPKKLILGCLKCNDIFEIGKALNEI